MPMSLLLLAGSHGSELRTLLVGIISGSYCVFDRGRGMESVSEKRSNNPKSCSSVPAIVFHDLLNAMGLLKTQVFCHLPAEDDKDLFFVFVFFFLPFNLCFTLM